MVGLAALRIQRSSPPYKVAKVLWARIESCHDGDTCKGRLEEGPLITLRLLGIDAPEVASHWPLGWQSGQVFGSEARDYLRSRVLGKRLKIEIWGQDIYHRYLAILWEQDHSINEELVEKGYAFALSPYEGSLEWAEKAEDHAKKTRRGLWALPNPPEEPKAFRSRKRRDL